MKAGERPGRAPARRFLEPVRKGGFDACPSTEVQQANLYRCSPPGRLELAREVYGRFVEIRPVVFGATLADTDRARDLLCGTLPISSRMAAPAAVMLHHDVEWVASFDAGFDRVAGAPVESGAVRTRRGACRRRGRA